jgi:hypothetical protein
MRADCRDDDDDGEMPVICPTGQIFFLSVALSDDVAQKKHVPDGLDLV